MSAHDGIHFVGKVQSFDYKMESTNNDFHAVLIDSILRYTSSVLSSKAIAGYTLKTMYTYSKGIINKQIPRKLLFLTHNYFGQDWGDYIADMGLHGFVSLLGSNTVDAYPDRIPVRKTAHLFNSSKLTEHKRNIYGSGFGYGAAINSVSKTDYVDIDRVGKNIENRVYDYIIIGSGHRHFDGGAQLPLFDKLCKHYNPMEIGLIFGADAPLSRGQLRVLMPCIGHFFVREGFS